MAQIWTGDINARASFTGEVHFYDTTLRDGEQTPGVVFRPKEKLDCEVPVTVSVGPDEEIPSVDGRVRVGWAPDNALLVPA